MTRGFVTLATGHMRYYQMAYNLLLSYRHVISEDSRYPFAIISDQENEYTRQFDMCMSLTNPQLSYIDKLQTLRLVPFDQTIFIDADSLVYGNISIFFDYFPSHGISCFGETHSPDSDLGWFKACEVGDWGEKVNYTINMHGGIIFICKDEMTSAIYQTALQIVKEYDRMKFKMFSAPCDEPVLSLAMAVHHCKPIGYPQVEKESCFCFYPIVKHVSANIIKKKLSYTVNGHEWYHHVPLMHWQNYNTKKPLYKREVMKLIYGNGLCTQLVTLKNQLIWITLSTKWKLSTWIYHRIMYKS